MSGSLLDVKEQVKQASDIVEVVGRYLALQRAGRGYKGVCPWHEDRRPSLQVDPTRQSFKCWVCDLGGDVFTFVMQMEKVEFREALELLADRAGIALAQAPAGRASPKQAWRAALAWAEETFHRYLLEAAAAEPAREYLAGRGFTPDSVRTFRLGFSPSEWTWLTGLGRQAGHSAEVLEQVGLVAPRQSGGVYDRFRGRVLFPIHDPQGRPVAFGGRVLPGAEEGAKYVNSPETPLFQKHRLLFDLDRAIPSFAAGREVIVTEGYTDCLIARQAGVENATAVLGTALTADHIRLLARYVQRVVLVLDGDDAGKRRADEVLELFVASPLDLRVLTLPEGLDPCDFILDRGVDAFRELVAAAPDAVEHRLAAAAARRADQPGSLTELDAVDDVLRILAATPAGDAAEQTRARLRAEQILSRIATRFRLGETQLRERLDALRGGRRVPEGRAAAPPRERAPAGARWTIEFVEILLARPDLLDLAEELLPPGDLEEDDVKRLYETMLRLHRLGAEATFDRIMLELQDPALQSRLIDLDAASRDKQQQMDDAAELHLREAAESFRRRGFQRRAQAEIAALKSGRLSEEEQLQRLLELQTEHRNRQGATEPMEG